MYPIIVFAVSAVFCVAMVMSDKATAKNFDSTVFSIYPPRVYIVVCVIGLAFFTWAFVYAVTTNQIAGLFFIPFIIVLLGLMWYCLMWRIVVFEDERRIVFRNMFLKKYNYSFDELEYYVVKPHHTVINTHNKKIEVDNFAPNLILLESHISNRKNNEKIKKQRGARK